DRAAALLVDGALGRMRSAGAEPMARFDQPAPAPPGGVLAFGDFGDGGSSVALARLLGEDARYILDCLGEDAGMSMVHQAFWQAELYLQSLGTGGPEDLLGQVEPGEVAPDAVQETMQEMEARAEQHAPEMSSELEDSVLVARQNFISTVRFGYFVRRSRQRLALERQLRGAAAGRSLDEYLAGVDPRDVVEMARVSTHEAALAVEHHATCMFGDFKDLFNPSNMTKLDMTVGDAQRLTMQAAAFGAALFEAEESAGRRYSMHFTSFGSRNERS
ncbi:unnamed protein product, partial [Prorocentrum cordatum]